MDRYQHLYSLDTIKGALLGHPTEPVPAYIENTGGGIMCVRVDVAPLGGKPQPDDPHLLLTSREEFDGEPGVAVGYYMTWEDTGAWPGTDTLRFVDDLSQLHALVAEGASLLCQEFHQAQGQA